MNRIIAAGLLWTAALAFAPAALAAGPHDWFPRLFEMCKETGRSDAECQKAYDERKTQIIKVCEEEGISGEGDCRTWLEKKRTEQMETMRSVCKENGVKGDAECQKWIEDRRAEFIGDFRAQCEREGLAPEECRARFAENVRKTQERNRQFVADCEATGLSVQECLKKLRDMRRAEAEKDAAEAPKAAKPPKIEKGQAPPPPQ